MSLKTALVVDDNKKICKALETYLQEMSSFKSIVTAFDGVDASRKLYNQKFTCIIIDIQMPKLTGLKVIADLVSSGHINPKSVIIISGEFSQQRVVEAKACGVSKFLVKPFDREKFTAMVNKVIS